MLALCLSGCQDDSAITNPPGTTGAPQITKYEFRQQLPGDPYTAIFAFYFDAPEAQLYKGKARFYVGSKESPLELEMSDLMDAAGLGRDAKRGEVGAALRFSDNITSDASVNLSLQLLDEKGRVSNRATVTLRFSFPSQ